MDRTPITSALSTAKLLVAAHGISSYLAHHSRPIAARAVESTDSGFRLDYNLDPSRSPWQDNPGCSIHVSYMASRNGQRTTEEGAVVLDHHLSINVRASADDMTIKRLKEREAIISHLTMLCEMLEVTLPPTVTVTVMTPEQHKNKTELEAEQIVGWNIHEHLGRDSLKGLRKDGRGKFFHNNGTPDGTYRYTHIRRRNARGTVVEQAKYIMTVRGATLTIKRIE